MVNYGIYKSENTVASLQLRLSKWQLLMNVLIFKCHYYHSNRTRTLPCCLCLTLSLPSIEGLHQLSPIPTPVSLYFYYLQFISQFSSDLSPGSNTKLTPNIQSSAHSSGTSLCKLFSFIHLFTAEWDFMSRGSSLEVSHIQPQRAVVRLSKYAVLPEPCQTSQSSPSGCATASILLNYMQCFLAGYLVTAEEDKQVIN